MADRIAGRIINKVLSTAGSSQRELRRGSGVYGTGSSRTGIYQRTDLRGFFPVAPPCIEPTTLIKIDV